MGVGDDPVGRDREAAAMAEIGHLAILERDDDDAHDAAPGGGDVVRPRRRRDGQQAQQQKEESPIAPLTLPAFHAVADYPASAAALAGPS